MHRALAYTTTSVAQGSNTMSKQSGDEYPRVGPHAPSRVPHHPNCPPHPQLWYLWFAQGITPAPASRPGPQHYEQTVRGRVRPGAGVSRSASPQLPPAPTAVVLVVRSVPHASFRSRVSSKSAALSAVVPVVHPGAYARPHVPCQRNLSRAHHCVAVSLQPLKSSPVVPVRCRLSRGCCDGFPATTQVGTSLYDSPRRWWELSYRRDWCFLEPLKSDALGTLKVLAVKRNRETPWELGWRRGPGRMVGVERARRGVEWSAVPPACPACPPSSTPRPRAVAGAHGYVSSSAGVAMSTARRANSCLACVARLSDGLRAQVSSEFGNGHLALL
jgi:hypothetical protein